MHTTYYSVFSKQEAMKELYMLHEECVLFSNDKPCNDIVFVRLNFKMHGKGGNCYISVWNNIIIPYGDSVLGTLVSLFVEFNQYQTISQLYTSFVLV